MSVKICAEMIFPVNRASVAIAKRSGWVSSPDVLDIFFGGWGSGEEVDEEMAAAQKHNPFANPEFKKQAELLLGSATCMKSDDRMAA